MRSAYTRYALKGKNWTHHPHVKRLFQHPSAEVGLWIPAPQLLTLGFREVSKFQENELEFQHFLSPAFPPGAAGQLTVQVLPKLFLCQIKDQAEVCASHSWTWGPAGRCCYTYWPWLMLHCKPVTAGFSRTINGNFRKCLWILSPAGDGAFTIRDGSAKSAQIHIFTKQFRCFSCSAFSFMLICKAWLQTQLPRFDGDSGLAPHSHPWSLHRGNIIYFPQRGKKG